MSLPQIVMDTNVLVAALRSRAGASFELLSLIGSNLFIINLSVPLVLEYESVLGRQLEHLNVTHKEVADLIDYLCLVGSKRSIFFLWRPYLRDPKDEMVLELAVTANCTHIVTFNKRDFAGAKEFGLLVVTPLEFLKEIGQLP